MKHKRQTLSKDETDIKTPKSKCDSSVCAEHGPGGEPGCQNCELPPGAACPVKDEDGLESQDCVKVTSTYPCMSLTEVLCLEGRSE